MLRDVRYALRTFLRQPAFAAGAVSILALGIAVNTIAFSALYALALRPLPVPDAGRVVRIYPVDENGRRGNLFSYSDAADLQAQAPGMFETLAAYVPADVTAGRASLDRGLVTPRAALAYIASSSYFEITHVRPLLGRVLQPPDDGPGVRVAVLSHAFWQRRFGGDAAAIGATIFIDARPFTIVGVAGPGFAGTEPLTGDLWLPASAIDLLESGHGDVRDRARQAFLIIARLRPGVSLAQADSALDVITARLAAAYPGNARPRGAEVTAGTFITLDSGAKPVVAAALAVVALVLLIACGNVANLLLARAVSRQREIAIRLAIGASRMRIVRQLVVEALLISLAAGGAALLLSTWTLRLLYRAGVAMSPFWWTVSLTLSPDVRVFAYTMGIAAAAGIVFGLIPALQAASPDLVRALHDVRSVGGACVSGARLRQALVVLQVAGSLVLLTGAGLLTRALKSAEALDLGFKTRDVVYAEFSLNTAGYSAPRAAAFNAALTERVRATTGVSQIALASHVPLHGGVRRITARLADAPAVDPVTVTMTVVSPAFFDVLGMPLVSGRSFTADDTGNPAIVVSEGLARRFWPAQSALGKAMTSPAWSAPRTVVGVVRDATDTAIWREKEMAVYVPLDGTRDPREVNTAIVRTTGNPSAMKSTLESTAASLDPDLRFTAMALDDLLQFWLLPSRVAAAGAATLAILALVLAASGLYAVLSFTVSHRLREIGIRMALGATSRDVAALITGDAARLVMAGMAIGGAVSAAAAPLLDRFLFGVSAFDPLTLAGVGAVLAAVGLAASYLPARRATRLPPLSVLRVD